MVLILAAAHNEYAHFIESVHRQRDKDERKQIGRSDNRRNEEDNNEGVAAVSAHGSSLKQTNLGKEERDDRYLEHQSHEEGQCGERAYIRRQVYLVDHISRHLISSEKAQGKSTK